MIQYLYLFDYGVPEGQSDEGVHKLLISVKVSTSSKLRLYHDTDMRRSMPLPTSMISSL
jgi:hypothetical protein